MSGTFSPRFNPRLILVAAHYTCLNLWRIRGDLSSARRTYENSAFGKIFRKNYIVGECGVAPLFLKC